MLGGLCTPLAGDTCSAEQQKQRKGVATAPPFLWVTAVGLRPGLARLPGLGHAGAQAEVTSTGPSPGLHWGLREAPHSDSGGALGRVQNKGPRAVLWSQEAGRGPGYGDWAQAGAATWWWETQARGVGCRQHRGCTSVPGDSWSLDHFLVFSFPLPPGDRSQATAARSLGSPGQGCYCPVTSRCVKGGHLVISLLGPPEALMASGPRDRRAGLLGGAKGSRGNRPGPGSLRCLVWPPEGACGSQGPGIPPIMLSFRGLGTLPKSQGTGAQREPSPREALCAESWGRRGSPEASSLSQVLSGLAHRSEPVTRG
ncbi:uncharacterized protein LOC106026738 [Cavia porcellus]|uniref:uncharacterized protein LOC106026738 n=1 Tax=Cavia porcellus TaxID=10141 RepID=UPI002FDFCDFC